MNAQSILSLAAQNDVLVFARAGKLVAKGKAEAIDHIKPLLKAHKDTLLQYVSTEQAANDFMEFYNERAAIYEYEAGLSREEAERLACKDTIQEYKNHHGFHPVTNQTTESKKYEQ